MKINILILLMASVTIANTYAQKRNLLIGTYTKNGKSEGIYVYEFDSQTGKATYKNKASGVSNPSYLDISKDGKFVYAANENKKGGVSAFSFNPVTGALQLLNSQPTHGSAACYIDIDNSRKFVFSGNYSSGNLVVYPVLQDGSLAEAAQVIQHAGSSADKSRQESPHVHSTILSPDQKFLLVSDLGTDKISTYAFDNKNYKKPLTPANPPFATAAPGSGPRHLDFHPNSRFVYALMEMTGDIIVYSYKNGVLNTIQTISMLPPEFKGKTGAADIHVSPDGKFVYASNRGDANEIVIFAIDQNSGKLTVAGRQSTLGKTPRNFVMDQDGRFLLAANQDSDQVVIFKRDQQSGQLTDTGERIDVGMPVCLKLSNYK